MPDTAPSRRRVFPPLYLLVSLILMVCLNLFAPVARIIDAPLRYFGLIPLVAAGVLGGSAVRRFHRTGTTIKPFETSTTLVLAGPYRLTRNPMYVGMAGILFGAAFLLGSLSPFVVVPAFVALIHTRFIRAEESILEQTFGRTYSDYKRRVRRWL